MDGASWIRRSWTASLGSRSSGIPAAVPARYPPVPTPALMARRPGARPIMSPARVSVWGGWAGIGMTAGPAAWGRRAAVPPTAIPGVVFTATTWRPSVTTRARARPGMTRGSAAGRRWRWKRGPAAHPLAAAAWGRGVAAPAAGGAGATASGWVLIKDDVDPVALASMSHVRRQVLRLDHGFIPSTSWNDKATALLD